MSKVLQNHAAQFVEDCGIDTVELVRDGITQFDRPIISRRHETRHFN